MIFFHLNFVSWVGGKRDFDGFDTYSQKGLSTPTQIVLTMWRVYLKCKDEQNFRSPEE